MRLRAVRHGHAEHHEVHAGGRQGDAPGAGDKTALFLDLGGSSYELGLPDDVRAWSLEDGEVAEEREKKRAKARDCERCGTAFRGPRCRHCGHEPATRVVEHVEAELEEATSGRAPLRRPRRGRLTRRELNRLLYDARRSDDPKAALIAIADQQGYARGWAGHIARIWGLVA